MIESAISYKHCIAKDFTSTNWKAILGYYDEMLRMAFDPVVFLNRSIALMELEGPQKALDSLNEIKDNRQIRNYYLYHAVLGELYYRLGLKEKAVAAFGNARILTLSKHEQRFLTDKITLIDFSAANGQEDEKII